LHSTRKNSSEKAMPPDGLRVPEKNAEKGKLFSPVEKQKHNGGGKKR